MITMNKMYSIHIVDIPDKGNYCREVTMAVSFTMAEKVAMLVIQRLLHRDNISMVLIEQNIYDVYDGKGFVGFCVINVI